MTWESIEFEILELQDQLQHAEGIQNYNETLHKIDILKASSISGEFLTIGDKAPDFMLPNAFRHDILLSEVLQKGKVVLSFFRGGWCPYCYLELRALQNHQLDIEDMGAQIIAICPERIDYCLNTMERNGITFNILSDKSSKLAKKFNLVYEADITEDDWGEIGLQYELFRGDIRYELPVPATYIIEQDMSISFAFADPDYRKRVQIPELLRYL